MFRGSPPSQRTLLLRRLQDVPAVYICYSASCWTDLTLGVSMEEDGEQNVVNSIQADEETKTTQRDADASGGNVSDTRTQSLERSEVLPAQWACN